MHISELTTSKYLKQSDFPAPALVTFASIVREELATDGEPELKWIAYFNEYEKGLVLNSTNGQIAARALGSEDSDDWIGKQIVLYVDPNVSFGGKVVGGLRFRAPKPQAQRPQVQSQPEQHRRQPAPSAPPRGGYTVESMDDDVPF